MRAFHRMAVALALVAASGVSAIECPAGEPFAGAVVKLKTGPCEGRWALDTFIGGFLPINLPESFQAQYYRVAGCMERKPDPKPCVAGKDTYSMVELYSIWPD